MERRSAGLLMYRLRSAALEVLLVHPGGPFWARKDQGAWSIPKGKVEEGEDALDAARREFEEETGQRAEGTFVPLQTVTQRSGKRIAAWAFEGDFDPSQLRSATFTMEWPPRSGAQREFPEVDRAAWFPVVEAKRRLNPGQAPLVDELSKLLGLS
ncbi:MAG: NUDIX domain-containing protein [Gemmatimonadaceae bacterium]